jgi:type I restriction enzyme S subunit
VSELPRGWASTTLGEIGNYVNGRGFRKHEWGESGRPIIRIQNLTGTGSHFNYYSGEADESYIARRGDLLISWAATLGAYVWNGPAAVVNQHIFKVESFIDPRFHRYLVTSVLEHLQRQAHGSGMVHVTRKVFDETPVALPPLSEQPRIVAAIEEHLSRLDHARALIDAAAQRARRMKLLILNAALTHVSETVALKDIADVRLGRQRSPKNHVGPTMRPYLRSANVTWSGLNLDDVKEMNFSSAEAETYELAPGDVLLAEASGSASEVGKPVVWRGEISGCCFQNTLIRVRSRGPLPDYLRFVFLRAALSGQFAQAAPGVGIHHLGSSRLAEWEIPECGINQQSAIVDEVERSFSLVDAAYARLSAHGHQARALRHAILARAFRGELVAQDPEDEGASVLLERIAVDRAAASKRIRQRGARTPA